jgi:hypothetical protein
MKIFIAAVIVVFILTACGSESSDESNYSNRPADMDVQVGANDEDLELTDSKEHADPTPKPIDREFFLPDEPAPVSIPSKQAAYLLYKLDILFDHDNGALWGIPLHAPVVLVDNETRDVIANRPDLDGVLQKHGTIYYGILPDDIVLYDIASITDFIGEQWILMPWAYITHMDENSQIQTLVHYAFHWHQSSFLGDMTRPAITHMNEEAARVSIRLEINALIQALQASDSLRYEIIRDALSIRAQRREMFNNTDSENSFELIEGLANYVEWSFALPDTQIISGSSGDSFFQMWADGVVKEESLEGMFGYLSGALYAFLLQEFDPLWTTTVNSESDLGLMLQEAAGITTLVSLEEIDLNHYGYRLISISERQWAATRENIRTDILNLLENYPVLIFYIENFEFHGSTTNGHLFNFDNLGLVYRGTPQLLGSFGRLRITNGDLIYRENYQCWVVSAKDMTVEENTVRAETWVLELSADYEIKPYSDNFIIARR